MHTQLVAGGLFSLAICVAVAAAQVLVVHVSARRNPEFWLLSAAAALIGLYAVGHGFAHLGLAGWPELWPTGVRLARGAILPALALSLVFTLRFAAPSVHRGVPLAILSGAVVLAFLAASAPIDPGSLRMERHAFLGLSVEQAVPAIPTRLAVSLLLGPLVQLVLLALVVRAHWQGRPEARPLLLGAGLLTLGVLNDAALALGWLRTLPLVPLGFVAFTVSVSGFFAAHYRAIRSELSRRVKELDERTAELSHSRSQLLAAQSELGRKEQLAVIGEMAAVIAHEVRNPLAVISNAVASLRREGLCRHDHEVLLAILDEEAGRLNRLVTDLLAYARPISVQRQRVVLHDLVQRAALLVGSRAGARFEFADNSSKGQIWADGNLLRQVFDNIVENAVQAMGAGGTVTVAVRPDSRGGVEGFAVSVADEGEGMDTLVRSRAKDPFFTTRPAGTGLGLAIVSRIVEAHGGKLEFDSRTGEGTTVTIFLPVGSEAPASLPDRASSRPPPVPSDQPTV